jgi:hypothetical protein
MILRLTPKTAALVGETPAEWQLLEKPVRAGAMDLRPADGGGSAASARSGARGAGAGGRRGGMETAAAGTAWRERYLEGSTVGSPTPTRWWRSDEGRAEGRRRPRPWSARFPTRVSLIDERPTAPQGRDTGAGGSLVGNRSSGRPDPEATRMPTNVAISRLKRDIRSPETSHTRSALAAALSAVRGVRLASLEDDSRT